MAQLLIRQIDDDEMVRLKRRAREMGTSVEALGRAALREVAKPNVEDKLAIVREMQAKFRAARVPGMLQTSGVDLIREDRDFDH